MASLAVTLNSPSLIHRVLVVDDYEPWRRCVSSTLQDNSRWQVVAEVSDGADAVNKASALRPDLILLDIGLPTINGIEAAHRILDHDPAARILFVSEHRSWDVAEAALATGARGYVIKSEAVRELLPAMNAIVNGRRFVSAALGGRALEDTGDGLARAASIHEALFCSDEEEMVDAWVRVAHDSLQAGDAVMIVSTVARLERIRTRLEALDVDVCGAIGAGRCQLVDVEDVLPAITLDERRFWEAATSLVMGAARTALGSHPRVALCGEIAPTLWRQGRGDTAVQLERLWHEVTRTYNIDIVCGYCVPAAYADPHAEVFRDICAAHSAVYSR